MQRRGHAGKRKWHNSDPNSETPAWVSSAQPRLIPPTLPPRSSCHSMGLRAKRNRLKQRGYADSDACSHRRTGDYSAVDPAVPVDRRLGPSRPNGELRGLVAPTGCSPLALAICKMCTSDFFHFLLGKCSFSCRTDRRFWRVVLRYRFVGVGYMFFP